MWPLLVVFTAPQVEDDSGLGQAREQFLVQQFIRLAADKALYISILPRTGFLNVQGADCGLGQLLLYFLGDELRTIGTADVLRRAAHSKQVLQRQGHVAGRERAGDLNRRAFPGVLIDYGEQPNLSSVVGSIGRKVIAPNMVLVLRTMPDAAALAAAGPPPPFPLFGRDLQVLSFPQAMDSLVVHAPASQQVPTVQQAMHAFAAIPRIKFDYPPHLAQQQAILIHLLRLVTLRAAWLLQDAAGSSLGNLFRPQTLADSFDCPPPTFGAYCVSP